MWLYSFQTLVLSRVVLEPIGPDILIGCNIPGGSRKGPGVIPAPLLASVEWGAILQDNICNTLFIYFILKRPRYVSQFYLIAVKSGCTLNICICELN